MGQTKQIDPSKITLYTISIDYEGSRFKHSEWTKYTIPCWQAYAKAMGINFVVIDQMDYNYTHPKWLKLKILDYYSSELMPSTFIYVDADTLPTKHLDRGFLDYGEYRSFCAAPDYGPIEWINNSIKHYIKRIAGTNIMVHAPVLSSYYNSGVFVANLVDLKHIRQVYFENKDIIQKIPTDGVGVDQTLLNFIMPTRHPLPQSYNVGNLLFSGLLDKNPLTNKPFFMDYGKILHFNNMPIELRSKLISDIYHRFPNSIWGSK